MKKAMFCGTLHDVPLNIAFLAKIALFRVFKTKSLLFQGDNEAIDKDRKRFFAVDLVQSK